MLLSEFDYILPEELIAQAPTEERTHSRMMTLDKLSKTIEHKHFFDIIDKLDENYLSYEKISVSLEKCLADYNEKNNLIVYVGSGNISFPICDTCTALSIIFTAVPFF